MLCCQHFSCFEAHFPTVDFHCVPKNLSFLPSFLVPGSNQRQQSLSDGTQWRSVPSERLQQRAELLLLVLAGQPAAAAGLRRSAAEQTQALPDHAAAVRQRHLARDRRARAHAGAGTGGECGTPGCLSYSWFQLTMKNTSNAFFLYVHGYLRKPQGCFLFC